MTPLGVPTNGPEGPTLVTYARQRYRGTKGKAPAREDKENEEI